MDQGGIILRLNLSAREVELRAPVEQFDLWQKKLPAIIAELAAALPQADSREQEDQKAAPNIAKQSLPQNVSGEESFGEYRHGFADSLKPMDLILIAGSYVQTRNGENSFSTGPANALLKEQGIKLTNASVAVQQNIAAKRIFAVAKGIFRVSAEGFTHLQEISR